MTPQETVDRAERAKELLDNPTLQKAFGGVREALIAKMEDSAIGDVAFHHEIALSLQALKSLRRQLVNWVDSGVLEREKAKSRSAVQR
jgi:hypothetical protein